MAKFDIIEEVKAHGYVFESTDAEQGFVGDTYVKEYANGDETDTIKILFTWGHGDMRPSVWHLNSETHRWDWRVFGTTRSSYKAIVNYVRKFGYEF